MEFIIDQAIAFEVEWNALCSLSYQRDYVQEIQKNYADKIASIASFSTVLDVLKMMLATIDTTASDYTLLFQPIIPEEPGAQSATPSVSVALCIAAFKRQSDPYEQSLLDNLNALFSKEHHDLNSLKSWVLDQASLTDNTKYLVMLLIDNYDYLNQKYEAFMEPLMAHNETLNNHLKPVLDSWIATINPSFLMDLFKEYKIEVDASLTTIPVKMSFVVFNSFVLNIQKSNPIAYCGCFVLPFKDAEDRASDFDDQLILAAKQLSDKTKLEILKFCKKEQRYGSEIAEHLGISGATVSHHMNSLTYMKFVSVNLVKNRVYYMTDVNQIKKIMTMIEKVLD